MLLAGYSYADFLQRLSLPIQRRLHAVLLIFSLIWLPILAAEALMPTGLEDPSVRILLLLTVTIGLPYFVLATTGPLVQAWFARSQPSAAKAQQAYRLFALSNLGSLVALLSYPFGVERMLGVTAQAWAWSAGFVLFVLVMLFLVWKMASYSDQAHPSGVRREPTPQTVAPSIALMGLWLLLSALASALLLSVSSHISQNIASVPFLWVLPLSLYLLSFVLAFEGRGGRGFYVRESMMLPSMVAVAVMAWGLTAQDGILDIEIAIPLYCIGLFLISLFCHGELSQSKPASEFLTRFYLMIALGGAIGGVSVSLLAPRIFSGYWEMPLSLLAIGLIGIWVALRQRDPLLKVTLGFGSFAAAVAVGHFSVLYWHDYQDRSIYTGRNFYGSLRVQEVVAGDNSTYRRLVHGVILHGLQHLGPDMRMKPTTYYSGTSGVGRAMAVMQAQSNIHVGVVGLGIGTLVSYARPTDRFRIYEINPEVITVARNAFFYLDNAPAQTTVIIGDARLQLAQEADQGFDLLTIDAFSSDAIPVHLLTQEAIEIYVRHLAPDGVLAIHVTNRYLALAPVVKQLADALGYASVLISHEPEDTDPWSSARSDWILITRNVDFLNHPSISEHRIAIPSVPSQRLWTDDWHNLFTVLK